MNDQANIKNCRRCGLRYDWLTKQPEFEKCTSNSSWDDCKKKYATPSSPNSYFLWDDQGVPVSQEIDAYAPGLGSLINYGDWIPGSVKPYKSRQHLVYFPLFGLPPRLHADGTVPAAVDVQPGV